MSHPDPSAPPAPAGGASPEAAPRAATDLLAEIEALREELRETRRALAEDRAAAVLIQQSLLPRALPQLPQMQARYAFLPCEDVGGDLVGVQRLDEHTVSLYVADVCGHGVPAAMITVALDQSLNPRGGITKRVELGGGRPAYRLAGPREVLERLDRDFPLERFGRPFTLCYALLDLRDGRLRYSSAAHPPPLLLRRTGEKLLLDRGGTLIGLGSDVPFEEGRARLEEGDRLLLYTDGLVEHRNAAGEAFGEDRLLEEFAGAAELDLEGVAGSLVEALLAHGGDAPLRDDVTLLCVEFSGARAAAGR